MLEIVVEIPLTHSNGAGSPGFPFFYHLGYIRHSALGYRTPEEFRWVLIDHGNVESQERFPQPRLLLLVISGAKP